MGEGGRGGGEMESMNEESASEQNDEGVLDEGYTTIHE
jgi:hypothetical protein